MPNKTVPFAATMLAACGLLLATLSTAATVSTDGQTTIIQTAPQPAPAPAPTAAPDKLSPGETHIALSLAKAELSKLGITNPTRAQLDAALHGGTVTTSTGSRVQLTGVLTQRQSGMGWGQIAHAMGLKLGAVVSASKTAGKHTAKNDRHDSTIDGSMHTTAGSASHEGGGHGGGDGGGGHGGGKK